jgi:glycopeptide antibiotics resistance protein
MLPGAILFVPIYCILNKFYFQNARKSILYFLFSCYLSVIYVLVGLPNVTYIRPELNLNLIPLVGMIGDWKNSILNVVLFIPRGIMLPILWNEFRKQKNTLICGFCASLAIELMQILTFRATDVNDLITNTLGGLIGWFLGNAVLKRFPKLSCNGTGKDAFIVFGSVLGIMFFIHPFIAPIIWSLFY